MDYENILVEYPAEGVGLVRLNRPRAFNSLTGPLMDELMGALEGMDADDAIGCMIITGNEKAFAAGADISEMAGATPVEMINMAFIARWERLRGMRAGRDAESAGVRVEPEQNSDRRQRRQVGPNLVHLLDGVQRVTIQRVEADLVELQRPQQADAVTAERGDPGLQLGGRRPHLPG